MSTEVHQAAETVTTSNELDLLFGPLFDEYFNGENQVVLKSSAVTTTDASNKRQQPDSTSSTSTLATTVTANGNFDLSLCFGLGGNPSIGDSLNLPDHRYSIYTIKRETEGLDDGVAAYSCEVGFINHHALLSFQSQSFHVKNVTSQRRIGGQELQVDQESKSRMIQVIGETKVNDLKKVKVKMLTDSNQESQKLLG
ncbi:hypothetical protein Tco_1449955 [Tanacetum coccineum]